jgi:phosphomannomutase
MKELIVFDLDGTLAASKSAIDEGMARLLDQLLKVVKVAVISGGGWPQFEKQVLAHLSGGDGLKNLFLLPTCGTKFFQYGESWKELYSEDFTTAERNTILAALAFSILVQATTMPKLLRRVLGKEAYQSIPSELNERSCLSPIMSM